MNRLLSIACCAVILALPAVAAPSASARKSMLGQERLLLNSLVEHNQLISHDTSMSAAADQIRGLIKEAEQAAKNHKWARARNKVDEAQNRYDSSIALAVNQAGDQVIQQAPPASIGPDECSSMHQFYEEHKNQAGVCDCVHGRITNCT